MSNVAKIVAVGLLAVVLVLGALAYTVLRRPAEASGPVTAIPMAASSAATVSGSASTQSTTTTADSTGKAPAASPSTAASASSAPVGSAAGAASDVVIAQIVPAESEARFIIDEVLNNAPKTVVGTTNQLAGEIAVDPQDPSKTRVGTIQVNARTLTTDSEFRNRAIKNRILSTDQYEFITFTPTQITGLPSTGAVGQTYSFQIVGDLTIRDVTKQVTFDVTATPTSETRLEGTAQTTMRYADWGITIPQVRQVASVSDTVRLELDFVAVPQ